MLSTRKASKLFKKYLKKYAIDGRIYEDSMELIKYDLSKKKQSNIPKKTHKTIEMEFDNDIIEIDRNISDLMECIWMCDIKTINSCENNIPKNYVWIEFFHYCDLQKFQNILFEGIDNYDPIKIRALDMQYYHDDAWKWDISFDTEVAKRETPLTFPSLDKINIDPDKQYMIMRNVLADYYTKLYEVIGERVFEDIDRTFGLTPRNESGEESPDFCSHCHCQCDSDDSEDIEVGKIKQTFICFSVRFPRSDYKWVLKRFQEYIVKNDFEIPDL